MVFSVVKVGPGMRYFSMAHVPRSMSWHRSEQKGRQRLSFQTVGCRQIGQVIAVVDRWAPAGLSQLWPMHP